MFQTRGKRFFGHRPTGNSGCLCEPFLRISDCPQLSDLQLEIASMATDSMKNEGYILDVPFMTEEAVKLHNVLAEHLIEGGFGIFW